MAIKCEEEFNPWPAFVDIFSAVILVLMLFLLVTLVNIGYYAQFKFKIQYTGSVATDELILQETTKKIELDEVKEVENTANVIQTKNQTTTISDEPIEQQIVEELQMATEIESVGIDLSDTEKDPDAKQVQKVLEEDRFFFIAYEDHEVHIDQVTLGQFKGFIKKSKEKYPDATYSIRSVDPTSIISATKTREISLGRSVGVRKLITKFDIESKKIKLRLQVRPNKIPDDLAIEFGLVVIEVINE